MCSFYLTLLFLQNTSIHFFLIPSSPSLICNIQTAAQMAVACDRLYLSQAMVVHQHAREIFLFCRLLAACWFCCICNQHGETTYFIGANWFGRVELIWDWGWYLVKNIKVVSRPCIVTKKKKQHVEFFLARVAAVKFLLSLWYAYHLSPFPAMCFPW